MRFPKIHLCAPARSYEECAAFFDKKAPRGAKWEPEERPLADNRKHHYRVVSYDSPGNRGEAEAGYYDVVLYKTALARFYRPGPDGSRRVLYKRDGHMSSAAFAFHVLGVQPWRATYVTKNSTEPVTIPIGYGRNYTEHEGFGCDLWFAGSKEVRETAKQLAAATKQLVAVRTQLISARTRLIVDNASELARNLDATAAQYNAAKHAFTGVQRLDVSRSWHAPIYKMRMTGEGRAWRKAVRANLGTLMEMFTLRSMDRIPAMWHELREEYLWRYRSYGIALPEEWSPLRPTTAAVVDDLRAAWDKMLTRVVHARYVIKEKNNSDGPPMVNKEDICAGVRQLMFKEIFKHHDLGRVQTKLPDFQKDLPYSYIAG